MTRYITDDLKNSSDDSDYSEEEIFLFNARSLTFKAFSINLCNLFSLVNS